MSLAVDLYCGLGGWTDGLLAEGWHVIGFDHERHEYGEHRYPAQLVVQDVLTLDGRQLKDANLIVASPPCTEYSYTAMPWRRAKQIARALRGEDEFPDGYTGSRTVSELNCLFDACFRIQREAVEAAGRHVPLVVENVCGAQPWVGRAKWWHGSYYLWGDVPALMPIVLRPRLKGGDVGGRGPGRQLQDDFAKATGIKVPGLGWFRDSALKNPGFRFDGSGRKLKDQNGYEREHPSAFGWKASRTSSKSKRRKMASALIAKIPFELASHIARVYKGSDR